MSDLSHFGKRFSKWLPGIANDISYGIKRDAWEEQRNARDEDKRREERLKEDKRTADSRQKAKAKADSELTSKANVFRLSGGEAEPSLIKADDGIPYLGLTAFPYNKAEEISMRSSLTTNDRMTLNSIEREKKAKAQADKKLKEERQSQESFKLLTSGSKLSDIDASKHYGALNQDDRSAYNFFLRRKKQDQDVIKARQEQIEADKKNKDKAHSKYISGLNNTTQEISQQNMYISELEKRIIESPNSEEDDTNNYTIKKAIATAKNALLKSQTELYTNIISTSPHGRDIDALLSNPQLGTLEPQARAEAIVRTMLNAGFGDELSSMPSLISLKLGIPMEAIFKTQSYQKYLNETKQMME